MLVSLADVFCELLKSSQNIYGLYTSCFVSKSGYTYAYTLRTTKQRTEFSKAEHLFLLVDKDIRGGFSGVVGPRYN